MTTFVETQNLSPHIADLGTGQDCPALPGSFIKENAGNPVSNLDTKATTATRHDLVDYRAYSEQGCTEEIAKIREVYHSFDGEDPKGKAVKLDGCRRFAWFARHRDTGDIRVLSRSCHLRWCPMCAKAKQAYITKSTSEWIASSAYPKLLTLTILHTDQPLREQINNLYNYFRRLRQRKKFRDRVTGGIWFFQIKLSRRDGLWHPHLHCLISGLTVSHSVLKRLWQDITYTSEIVDVRSITDKENAARHVARYAARPAEVVNMSLPERIELVEAMHGRRLVGSWGDAKNISFRPPVESGKDEWRNLGSWRMIIELKDCDDIAAAILNAWKKGEPLEPHLAADCFCDIFDDAHGKLQPRPPPQDFLPNFYGDHTNV